MIGPPSGVVVVAVQGQIRKGLRGPIRVLHPVEDQISFWCAGDNYFGYVSK